MKKISIAVLCIVALAACSRLATPTQKDADRAAVKWGGTTLADLNEGKTLYQEHCSTCHSLKSPSAYTEAEWKGIVPVMAAKAKIDDRKKELIQKYVMTMSKK